MLEKEIKEKIRKIEDEKEKMIKNGKINIDKWSEYGEKLTGYKRELSLLENKETAVDMDFEYRMDVGAPMPSIIGDEHNLYLIYYLETNYAGEYEEIGRGDDYIILVHFPFVYGYKSYGLNDEVILHHRLAERGIEAYEVQEIVNSTWIEEERSIHKNHTNYKNVKDRWDSYRHLTFNFHDSILEVIAEEMDIKVYKGVYRKVLDKAYENFLKV